MGLSRLATFEADVSAPPLASLYFGLRSLDSSIRYPHEKKIKVGGLHVMWMRF